MQNFTPFMRKILHNGGLAETRTLDLMHVKLTSSIKKVRFHKDFNDFAPILPQIIFNYFYCTIMTFSCGPRTAFRFLYEVFCLP